MPSGRYLIETSGVDGYLLEDGSGVLLLDPFLAHHQQSMVKNVRTLTTDPFTWNHTIPADCRAFVVFAGNQSSATDQIVGVTVNGVALTRKVRATDTVAEPGGCELWFLGTGIPAPGVQVVSVDFSSATGDDFILVSMAFVGDVDAEVIDTDSLSEDQTSPNVTLQHLGRLALDVIGIFSGHGLPTDLSDRNPVTSQWRVTEDWTISANRGCIVSSDAPATADQTVGYLSISGFTDDCAFTAITIAEVLAAAAQGNAAVHRLHTAEHYPSQLSRF